MHEGGCITHQRGFGSDRWGTPRKRPSETAGNQQPPLGGHPVGHTTGLGGPDTQSTRPLADELTAPTARRITRSSCTVSTSPGGQ
jgi:hypothetical protein